MLPTTLPDLLHRIHTLDHPASLKQYAEWFRYFFLQQAAEENSLDRQAEVADGLKPRNGIRSKWEKYKKYFASTGFASFVSLPPSFLLSLSTIHSLLFFIYHVIRPLVPHY